MSRRRPTAVEAARHICQEAGVVLSSLRGGPPAVARGELAADLCQVRLTCRAHFLTPTSAASSTTTIPNEAPSTKNNNAAAVPVAVGPMSTPDSPDDASEPSSPSSSQSGVLIHKTASLERDGANDNDGDGDDSSDGSDSSQGSSRSSSEDEGPSRRKMPQFEIQDMNGSFTSPASPDIASDRRALAHNTQTMFTVGPYARPFLAVVMDPRAAGPHTLVALRALYRLLDRQSLVVSHTGISTSTSTPSLSSSSKQQQQHAPSVIRNTVSLEPLMQGVLACKFEQTDAGADEAVEMAIADFLSLLTDLNLSSPPKFKIRPQILMEAFHTVFVTRNTFIHSPALCYHFEQVLTGMVSAAFSSHETQPVVTTKKLILDFLVTQLLHTPLSAGSSSSSSTLLFQRSSSSAGSSSDTPGNATLAAAAIEANAAAHDATRILCLRLVRCCLRHGWGDLKPITPPLEEDKETGDSMDDDDGDDKEEEDDPFLKSWKDRTLTSIIEEDLCLSLLLTGQAIWAYHDGTSNISPGVISLEVLSEICATLSELWNISSLRDCLTSQFETIFTGFYQRALALLRKRPNPVDSASFNANLVFDAEVEIILESLVDILCLHDNHDDTDNMDGDHKIMGGGALETLFLTYDCAMSRSDVASGLVVELCRCCGGTVGETGQVVFERKSSMSTTGSVSAGNTGGANTPAEGTANATSPPQNPSKPKTTTQQHRHVPAHLKELCAEALVGLVKCLFRDSHVSDKDKKNKPEEKNEKPNEAVDPDSPPIKATESVAAEAAGPNQSLRYIKSRKDMMRRAALLFNESSTKGIQYLAVSKLIPSPATPQSVASFLRNGIVLGLDKRAVGAYLGEVGKGTVVGKNPPNWSRDWFHKEALEVYCSLFRFENQSLLDGLRMFLAAFRLPGEAQQIDRILQAFAESCGRNCDESGQGRLKLFSQDEKKASDGAYLLSFSIIMLNTDLHNDNIRPDRKMTLSDFIKNNRDYGRDITDEGRLLPSQYLETIYHSIKEEQIRTMGEGADGVMTVERWKDVLRGNNSKNVTIQKKELNVCTELLLDNIWMPLLSAVGGFWGVTPEGASFDHNKLTEHTNVSGMLGAQGARLGMDIASELLLGVQNIGRIDIFQEMFVTICYYSGLLGEYNKNAVERTNAFIHSVERQSAVIIAINTANESGENIGFEGWKCVWGIIFELRDLKMLGGGRKNKRKSIIFESDPDLLTESARREWTMHVLKGDRGSDSDRTKPTGMASYMFGAMGRALFGSDDQDVQASHHSSQSENQTVNGGSSQNLEQRAHFQIVPPTIHGKEELMLWDDLAPSDDEDSVSESDDDDSMSLTSLEGPDQVSGGSLSNSAGAAFESQLIQEDNMVYSNSETPQTITGLERVDDSRVFQISPRNRVRKRLSRVCDFAGLVSESRYLDMEGIQNLLGALLHIVHKSQKSTNGGKHEGSVTREEESPLTTDDDLEISRVIKPTTSIDTAGSETDDEFIISPASEAFAEVLICEITLKNRDRVSSIWDLMLHKHYCDRLEPNRPTPWNQVTESSLPHERLNLITSIPGMEKCVTSLLRICYWTVHREDISNTVLASIKLLYPPEGRIVSSSPNLNVDKHLAEGLWRICRNVDGLKAVGIEGWGGLLGLVEWCAMRSSGRMPGPSGQATKLAEDDPALQAFRSLHLMLHAVELRDVVPFSVSHSIRALIKGGERANLPKLSIAALDLLLALHTRVESVIPQGGDAGQEGSDISFWTTWWLPVLEGMSEAAEDHFPNVRQHALSMLTDAVIDRHGRAVPSIQLCNILGKTCIPLAERRIIDLLRRDSHMEDRWEEIMIEFELCISLVFKPFLHHLQLLISVEEEFDAIWISILGVMTQLLSYDVHRSDSPKEGHNEDMAGHVLSRSKLLLTTRELATEHLRNAVMVLMACGVLNGEEQEDEKNISSMTWSTLSQIDFCKDLISDWKNPSNFIESNSLAPKSDVVS